MSTAWLIITGTQLVRDIGDLARFGAILFQVIAPLQLALAVFFASLLSASEVAQEKDRKTLILLLLTNMTNCELVLGKLLASLLNIMVLLAAAVPVFMLSALLGGVSFGQIGRAFAVTLASVIVCGSLGSTLALWREKTFQALAMTLLVLVLWLSAWEIVATGVLGKSWLGLSCQSWAIGFSPWQAIIAATKPYVQSEPVLGPLKTPLNLFLAVALAALCSLNGIAIAMVRRWNPSREIQLPTTKEGAHSSENIWSIKTSSIRSGDKRQTVFDQAQYAKTRRVWNNPIVWREIRTWAYGRKIIAIRLVYVLLFALSAGCLCWMSQNDQVPTRNMASMALAPLFLLSLVLINAQAVTSLTSERDSKAIDLLLVTDLTPKEVVYGKLGGVFYNTKEMTTLPMLLCVYLWFTGSFGLENLVYLIGGLVIAYIFVATLGLHVGMTYPNSRMAIATSLGTLFFLLVGVATCMRMMVAFSGSFQVQLLPFFVLIVIGGIGLYVALGARNPSTAIGVAAFVCPLATFYAITSFLLNYTLGVFLVTVAAYGFTTAAMLVPAIYEFDVATGRTTIDE